VGWHTVLIISHDRWHDIESDPDEFFESVRRAVLAADRRPERLVLGTEKLGTFHHTDTQLKAVRDAAQS